MTAATLCADFASSGVILGVGLDANPEDWDDALADDQWAPLIDSRKGRMRRDYGVVEVHFARDAGQWRCLGVALQVHRLVGSYDEIVPPGLRHAVGSTDTEVQLSDVLGDLDARGVPHELILDRDRSAHERHWIAAGAVVLTSAASTGVVWSASTADDADTWRHPVM